MIYESAFEIHYNLYCSVTEDLAKDSIKYAINEEVTTEVLKAEKNEVPFYGINIMTDAGHGCRRHAAHSYIIVIGQTYHRVVGLAVVIRQNDPGRQRPEIRLVENMYRHCDENNISISISMDMTEMQVLSNILQYINHK